MKSLEKVALQEKAGHVQYESGLYVKLKKSVKRISLISYQHTVNMRYLPIQEIPLPLYPELQMQPKDPSVLPQEALA